LLFLAQQAASASPCALQMNSMVGELSLYDVANTKGVAADVSHINTPAQVQVGF
jgi:malate/lactate dehydrogenase